MTEVQGREPAARSQVAEPLTVEVRTSIRGIPRAAWNSLVETFDGSVFHTYEWLAALETSTLVKLQARHVLVWRTGRLIAAAPFYLTEHCPKLSMFVGYYTSFGTQLNVPMLLGHSMYAQSSLLLCNKPEAEEGQALLRTLDEIWQAEANVPLLGFPLLNERGSLASVLEGSGFRLAFLACSNHLDIRWSSFDEYLASRTSNMRRNIRQTTELAEREGIRCRTGWTVEDAKKVADMAKLTAEHHGSPAFFDVAFIEQLLVQASDYVRFFELSVGGRTILTCLALLYRGNLVPWSIGFEYESLRRYNHYNLLYVLLIRWAIENSVRSIHFGRSTYYIKNKYGCVRRPIYAAFKSYEAYTDTMSLWLQAVTVRARAELAQFGFHEPVESWRLR
jgi:predicted N-acyltransferase